MVMEEVDERKEHKYLCLPLKNEQEKKCEIHLHSTFKYMEHNFQWNPNVLKNCIKWCGATQTHTTQTHTNM